MYISMGLPRASPPHTPTHALNDLRMLNLHLTRDKVSKNLHITQRALLPTFLNRLAAVRLEVEEERLEEFLIKEVTRTVPISGRVATI